MSTSTIKSTATIAASTARATLSANMKARKRPVASLKSSAKPLKTIESGIVDAAADTRSRPMYFRLGMTIGEHLDEFDAKDANGNTFADIVYLHLWNERAPKDFETQTNSGSNNASRLNKNGIGAGSKKRAHEENDDEPPLTVSANLQNDVLAHAKRSIASVKRPSTKKVKTNAGKATPALATTRPSSNDKLEYSNGENEHQPLKRAVSKIASATAPKNPAINKTFTKSVGAKVNGTEDDYVPPSQRPAKLTPAQIAARKASRKGKAAV
ncbi:hypothetical protein N0V90_008441 [Kalmusia sp. IMI 367209]|nr:hypothetical protein N0V90_008441 [Kalmusia sp. IMI 367209]